MIFKKSTRTVLSIVLGTLLMGLAQFMFSTDVWKYPVQTVEMENGMQLYYQKDTTSAVSVVQVLIRGGRINEPQDMKGLAYMAFRFALEIPDDAKLREMMSQATRIYLISMPDYTLLSILSLSDNIESAIKISSKIMLKPLISNVRIGRLKETMEYLRDMEQDEEETLAFLTQQSNLFGSDSYSGSDYGTEESVKSIKKKDVDSFYRNHFHSENVSIIVTSDLEMEAISKMLEKYFEKIPKSQVGNPLPFQKDSRPEESVDFIEKDNVQSLISVAIPLGEMDPKEYILGLLLEQAMGKGIGSRLWKLRAEDKLAYTVNANLTQMRHEGMLELFLQTESQKQKPARLALNGIITEMASQGMSEEELEMTKTFTKASFLRNNERKDIRTRTIARILALGLDIEFLNSIMNQIDQVTLEEMNAFIQKILDPRNAVELTIGPEK
ncbi:M16 family metallopeptidase [Acidobacteriota bacterium]